MEHNTIYEVPFKREGLNGLLVFDGQVLEPFYAALRSEPRYHISMIRDVSYDKHPRRPFYRLSIVYHAIPLVYLVPEEYHQQGERLAQALMQARAGRDDSWLD
ncbi:MAG: hypothetical protein GYB68_12725 [Chloroflexi bacterium]|nr:hypothetical protein [Chloroflexota bacterium]